MHISHYYSVLFEGLSYCPSLFIYHLCLTYSDNHLVAVVACIPETLKAIVDLPSRESYPFVSLQGLFHTQEHSALGPNLFARKTTLLTILIESYWSKKIAITIMILIVTISNTLYRMISQSHQ